MTIWHIFGYLPQTSQVIHARPVQIFIEARRPERHREEAKARKAKDLSAEKSEKNVTMIIYWYAVYRYTPRSSSYRIQIQYDTICGGYTNALCWLKWYIYIPPRRRSMAIPPSLPSSPRWGAMISKSRSAASSKPSMGGQYHSIPMRWDEHTNYIGLLIYLYRNLKPIFILYTHVHTMYLPWLSHSRPISTFDRQLMLALLETDDLTPRSLSSNPPCCCSLFALQGSWFGPTRFGIQGLQQNDVFQ